MKNTTLANCYLAIILVVFGLGMFCFGRARTSTQQQVDATARKPRDPEIFAQHLRKAITDNDDARIAGQWFFAVDAGVTKRILALIDAPLSAKRTRALVRMERHAAAHLDVTAENIDWSSIDWRAVLVSLLRFLAALLPFLT